MFCQTPTSGKMHVFNITSGFWATCELISNVSVAKAGGGTRLDMVFEEESSSFGSGSEEVKGEVEGTAAE